MPPPDPHSLAPLLQEMSWLSRLARELVRDPHAADDAVQETLSAALEHHPDTTRPVRGWLATTLRNILRQQHRSTRRRDERERQTSRAESLPSASELASRVELQRKLAALVLALPEPRRSTIVLRYFEGLAPRTIAREQGVPLATVKSRLQRGLAELRAQLDHDEGGDGHNWMLALAPLLRPPLEATHVLPALPATLGILAMKAKLLTVCALAAALLVFLLLRTSDAPIAKPASSTAESTPLHAPQLASETAVQPSAISAESERAAATKAPVAASAPTPTEFPASVAKILSGLVLDTTGAALANVSVRAEPQPETARSDASGRFTFANAGSSRSVVITEPGYATVLAGSTAVSTRDSVVVAAHAVNVEGRVVDPSGTPIPGARLVLELPAGFRGRFSVIVDDSQQRDSHASSADDGSFHLANWPAVAGARLNVSHAGFQPADLGAPLADSALTITLEPASAPLTGIHGRVLDALGAPVEHARVGWGRTTVESSADGSFTFADDGTTKARTLVAVHKGSLPGRVDALADDEQGHARWPNPLVIVLGGPPLTIRGRVEDADGTPRANVRVWSNESEYLGERVDPNGESDAVYIESELRGGPPGWNPVRTDDEGRFTIEGLCVRDYHLTAMDDKSVQRVDALIVHAGASGVVLRFSKDALLEEVSGKVIDRRGQGVPHVTVRVTTDAYHQDVEGWHTGTWHETGAEAQTDADGRFTVHDMPRERAYLRFSGEEVLSTQLGQGDLEWKHGTSGIVVTIVRRCHFQVQLRDPDLADEFELLDRDGKTVDVVEFVGNGSISSNSARLTAGKSSTLATADSAQVLVLKLHDKEVTRVPIELSSGELSVIRP